MNEEREPVQHREIARSGRSKLVGKPGALGSGPSRLPGPAGEAASGTEQGISLPEHLLGSEEGAPGFAPSASPDSPGPRLPTLSLMAAETTSPRAAGGRGGRGGVSQDDKVRRSKTETSQPGEGGKFRNSTCFNFKLKS